MTHLILINPNNSFAYQKLTQSSQMIVKDVCVDGKLPDYIKMNECMRNASVKYTASTWQDWVVLLPVDQPENKDECLAMERRLTMRQLDVLECLSRGLTGKQIAGRLSIHQRSVSLHISALKQKLNANTTAECVQKAARLGILKPDGW